MTLDARVVLMLSTFKSLRTRHVAVALDIKPTTALSILAALDDVGRVTVRAGRWALKGEA
ncbi:hypothetical protein [Deinococcus sp. QL22]|uniref:hypothetical protein n=1 Tax=Deinococcus sp. QL22 TaxID=2939437 RepID=UPI002017C592|nr:hypothetical protein [Deinococcus sp. QL22]UQN05501.1 hypothetical protein M1R55_11505 [Deinococcus sp. QL22]